MRCREAPPPSTLNTPMIWGGWPLTPRSKVSPQITVMHSAGVSLSPPPFPRSPFSLPLATLVVKNSLDAVCIASSRMSPLMADCVGKGSFRRPEGIDGAPSVCWGTLHGFDVCIRSQCYRHARSLNETHKWLSAWPQTATPVSLTAVGALTPKVHS